MGIYHFELLAKYNKEANLKMNSIIKTLSPEEWDQQFTGYFKSVHELCSHTYIADFTWLKRFKELNVPVFNSEIFIKNYTFQEVLFKSISEYLEMRTELDNIVENFCGKLTEIEINQILKYTNSKGTSFEKKTEGLLIHLFNHQTHHRAMVSLYLEMLGRENDYNNVLPVI
jgi:uncharacterized damage-inducible protein DinB